MVVVLMQWNEPAKEANVIDHTGSLESRLTDLMVI